METTSVAREVPSIDDQSGADDDKPPIGGKYQPFVRDSMQEEQGYGSNCKYF